MRTFSEKQNQAQPKSSANLTRLNSLGPAVNQKDHPLQHLQRTIGNQATQRLLQTRANRREPASENEVDATTEVRSGTPTATRFAHEFSRTPVHAPAPRTIQPKLTVNTPGDIYEQEADHIAEQVMRMPDSKLQRTCACGGGCSSCQTEQPTQKRARVQTKQVGSSNAGQTTAPPIVHEVLASAGQPLDAMTRAFFEPRFGHDFSHVRVHSGEAPAQSAREVNAKAYTVGHNVVVGGNQFAPGTQEGRRLLAHELTHVVQQSGAQGSLANQSPAQAHPMLQRDMGFEFQVSSNTLTTNQGQKFGVKSGKFFHKVPPTGKNGVELQTDTGGDLEFQTDHFRDWSQLETQIQDAVNIVNDINKNPKDFPFNQESRLQKEGLLKKGEKLWVNVADASFSAFIQSTEGVALDQYQSLLKEHEHAFFIAPVLSDAQNILNAAVTANKSIKLGVNLDNLRGFLQMIIDYVRRGQSIVWDKTACEPVKATFLLMARTDFSSAFKHLLRPADEKTLFKDIVKSNAIQTAVGIAANDPFFKTGYWGHPPGGSKGYAFFEGGTVKALAPESKTPIHDCSTKAKTAGVDVSLCGKKVPDSVITVGRWLNSIINQTKDELSPPSHGSSSMGKFPVATKGPEKGLVVVESRDYKTPRNRLQPASKWVDFAEELFSQAATCRARPGTGTELIYGGKKKFNPKNCP